MSVLNVTLFRFPGASPDQNSARKRRKGSAIFEALHYALDVKLLGILMSWDEPDDSCDEAAYGHVELGQKS